MTSRTRLLVIVGILALGVIALTVVLARCEVPSSTPTATPGATTTATSDATPTPSGPIPTLTREEELLFEMQHYSSQSAASPEECSKILTTKPACSVIKSVERVTRPEWEELFPQTEFFLMKMDSYSNDDVPVRQSGVLIVEQAGQRYTAATFDRLLEANDIATITDENRELVARTLALMLIPGYLEGDVVFAELEELEEGEWPGGFGGYHNYKSFVTIAARTDLSILLAVFSAGSP